MLGQSVTIDRHLTLFHLSVVSFVLVAYFSARHGDSKTLLRVLTLLPTVEMYSPVKTSTRRAKKTKMTHFGLPRIDLYVQSNGDTTTTSRRTIWPRTGTSVLVAQMLTQARWVPPKPEVQVYS